MAMKPETVFRKRIQPELERLRHCVIIPIQQVAIRGIPDFLLCIRGVFVGVELKQSKDYPPSALQTYWINRILVAGGVAVVCYPENYKEVYKLLHMLSIGKSVEEVLKEEEKLRREWTRKQEEIEADVQTDIQ